MFCTKCGSQNADANKFCSKCGAELQIAESEVPQQVSQNVTPNVGYQKSPAVKQQTTSEGYIVPSKSESKINFDKSKIKLYVLMGLAALNAIFMFCPWITSTYVNQFFSYFGGSNIADYNPFNYMFDAFTSSNIGGNADLGSKLIFFIILLLAVAAMTLDIVFIVKTIQKKADAVKLCFIGSILMLIASVVISILFGFLVAILGGIYQFTAIPFLAIMVSIAGIVLSVVIRKQEHN